MAAARVLAVIPARSGSKGLPGKNTRPLAGLPLLVHSIRAAELTPCITRCIVSTDDEDIAEVARNHGGDVPWLRPAEFATDSAPMAPVLRHALEAVEAAEDETYDVLVLLDPTSPTREPAEIEAAVTRLMAEPDLDGIVAVSEPPFNPLWVGVRPTETDERVLERFFAEGTGVVRRQDAARYLRINGNFYVWRTAFVRRLGDSWFDEGRHGRVEIPEERAFAIDHLYEFQRLEALLAQGVLQLPWLNSNRV